MRAYYCFYTRHGGLIAFCVFAILAYLIGYKEEIPQYKLFMHGCIAFAYWATFYLCTRMRNERMVACIVFLYSLLLSVTLRYLFWEYTGDPYEHTYSCDVYSYERWAVRGIGKSMTDFVSYLMTSTRYNLDDMGFFTFMQFFHNLFRDVDFVRNFLILLNACMVMGASIMVGKIGSILELDDYESKIVMAFYGLFPFWMVSSAMGLKENLFCFIITAALYNIYRYKESRQTYNIVAALMFIMWTYLFRFAITLMLIIVLALVLVANEGNKRKLLVGMAGMVMLLAVGLNVIMNTFAGLSMDDIANVTAARMKGYGGQGMFGWMVSGLAAFIGPFPNFVRTGQYGIYFALGLTTKVLCTVFVLFASYVVVKRMVWRMYPILAYLGMGYVMLLSAGVSLDIRYHCTFFPAFCLLMGYGISQCEIKRVVLSAFSLLAAGVILMYNLR